MTGELPMSTRSELLKNYLAKDRISGFNDDKWLMIIQTELLNLLRSLPVCVGLGVKCDVHEIK